MEFLPQDFDTKLYAEPVQPAARDIAGLRAFDFMTAAFGINAHGGQKAVSDLYPGEVGAIERMTLNQRPIVSHRILPEATSDDFS